MIFLQASRGLKYLHDHNITNRDVKVDNILCLKSVGQGDEIKIADFTTVRYSKDDISYFVSGTPGFRCPEQQNASMDGYSCKSGDIWSLGISMYTFYCEYFPFMGETEMEIDLKAQNEELKFPEHCPIILKDLITQMTHKNWKTRINIQQVIEAFMNMKL
jgi:serine/threonine protein kinase